MQSAARHRMLGRRRPPLSVRLTTRMNGLYWRVFAVNAAILTIALVLLAVTPVTVNRQITREQFLILLGGLAVMVVANAFLLRLSLAPLRQLTSLMRRVDLLEPGRRLDATGTAEVAEVIAAFNSTLARLEDERRSSMVRVLSAQEAERRRIAQELHDQIGQNLTAVLLDVQRLAEQLSGGAADTLEDMEELVREVMDEVRRISYELRPSVLDDLGLAVAIESLCDGIARRSGIAVSHSIDDPPGLDADAELVVYRITQEALTNAVRHSGCGSIAVTLRSTGDAVVLSVHDDGVGVAGAKPGGGVRGMRERAVTIHGTLDVVSSPHGGADVALRVPTAAA
jgi:two-component system, NarL family, sensor histidine kinase UhpB